MCPHAFILGSDMCPPLVSIAGGRGHEVLVCDCLNLPYRSNAFDAVLCIAVIHHLSTRERRVDALRELVRVTRPGGKVLVYVWAMEQERKKVEREKGGREGGRVKGKEGGREVCVFVLCFSVHSAGCDGSLALTNYKFSEESRQSKTKEKEEESTSNAYGRETFRENKL